MKKYKVTGKFCILNSKGEVVKNKVYINKIEEENDSRLAMKSAIKKMTEKFAKKYNRDIKFKQISNVVVKRI